MIDLILLGARYLLLLLITLFILQVVRAIHADLRDLLPAHPRGRALLEVQDSPGDPAPGTHFPLEADARIGGEAGCTVLTPGDPSPASARIVRRDGGFWVEAVEGGAATLVNGTRVQEPRPLREGDRLTVGPVVFRFHWSGG